MWSLYNYVLHATCNHAIFILNYTHICLFSLYFLINFEFAFMLLFAIYIMSIFMSKYFDFDKSLSLSLSQFYYVKQRKDVFMRNFGDKFDNKYMKWYADNNVTFLFGFLLEFWNISFYFSRILIVTEVFFILKWLIIDGGKSIILLINMRK